MATMNISLPETMRLWVESRAVAGRYGDAGAYVRDLIRRDQEGAGRIAAMQRLVDEARASGISSLSAEDILATTRTEAEGRRAG